MTDYELRKLAKYVVKEAAASGALRRILVPDRMMTVEGAAKMLGLSAAYLRNNHSGIPHRKVGKRLMFSRHELEDYISKK